MNTYEISRISPSGHEMHVYNPGIYAACFFQALEAQFSMDSFRFATKSPYNGDAVRIYEYGSEAMPVFIKVKKIAPKEF